MPDDLIKKMTTDPDAKPVIENAKLPLMTDKPLRPRLISGKTQLMATEPKPDTGKQRRMAPVKKTAVRVKQPTLKRELPDMQGGGTNMAGEAQEGYVRLQLRISGDRISVVGAKAVEGPLVDRSRIYGSLAYDVTVGPKRIAAGSIQDLGERRSFPNESPDAPPEQREHFISEVPTFEISVRVPASEVTMASLPRVNIRLYRIKEEVDASMAAPGPLGDHFTRELREVGRVNGIRLEDLAAPYRAELRKALRR